MFHKILLQLKVTHWIDKYLTQKIIHLWIDVMYQVSSNILWNMIFSFFSEFNDSVVSTTDNLTSQLEAGRITEVRNEQRRVRTSSDSQRDPTRQNSIQPSTTALNTAVTFTNRPVITDTNHVSGTNSYHHSSLVVRVVMTSSNTSILMYRPDH